MNYDDKTVFLKKKAAEKERSSAGGRRGVPGMSNTRYKCSNPSGQNVFIDYLYVRFNGAFHPYDEEDLQRFAPLFRLLKINPQYYREQKSKTWKNFLQFDNGTFIKSSTEFNESKDGESCYLEMKGEGCRSFELRGGDWQALISWLSSNVNHVNRIDVSMDDFEGVITINQILDRVHKGSYSTYLKTYKIINGSQVSDERPQIIQSHNDGCTITFGGRQTKQLCIYNKAAERMAKNYVVEHGTWVRYEARFMHDVALDVLYKVNKAYQTDTLPEIACGLIKGLVEFKEHSNNSFVRQRDTWSLWDKLLNDAAKIIPVKQSVVESSLSRKQSWLASASGRILSKAYLANPSEFQNYIKHSVAKKINDFNFVDLSEVNDLKMTMGEPTITMEDALVSLKNEFGAYEIPSDYLRAVLKPNNPSGYYEEFKEDEDDE